jgi:hypothetical protein
MADVQAPPETSGGGGGNVFTRKIGPLPMWGWMGIVLLLAVFYYLYKKNSSSTAYSSSPSSVNTPGGVDASLVPQFVNQTYTTVEPPTAPNVTVNNNTGGTTPPPAPSNLQETFSKGHVITPNHNKATVGWSTQNVGASGATQLKVGIDGPGLGPGHSNTLNPQYRYIPASATTATFDSLLPGHNYTVSIQPVDAKGHNVGSPGYVDLKTT